MDFILRYSYGEWLWWRWVQALLAFQFLRVEALFIGWLSIDFYKHLWPTEEWTYCRLRLHLTLNNKLNVPNSSLGTQAVHAVRCWFMWCPLHQCITSQTGLCPLHLYVVKENCVGIWATIVRSENFCLFVAVSFTSTTEIKLFKCSNTYLETVWCNGWCGFTGGGGRRIRPWPLIVYI